MKEIETARYFFRYVKATDCENIFKILSDQEVIKNLNMQIESSLEDSKTLIKDYLAGLKNKTKFPFAIIDKNNNDFIGVFLIKLDLYDDDCYEFTIYLNKNHWHKGVYTEILPEMIDFAFTKIQTGNFRGFVKEYNEASSRVLEKTGFKLEKIFKVPNIDCNIKSYLITKSDYKINILKK